MEAFNLNSGINANKIFLINRSEIEGRLEAEYYRPEINLLEKKIRNKTCKRLKDFIIKIASGATPSVTEDDKYYSDKENGIPFLRVQNLQTNGKLYLEDLKYINKETHEKYLKRSQVAEGDLLIKITGVGRMAIASVAPEGFIGNTNQHMVVVKTGSRKTSEYLANYLNLDLTEKLATRRATGATRPALDYPAIKSLPIVEGIDFKVLEIAEKKGTQKQIEANALLDSINENLLDALKIVLPKQKKDLINRMFKSKISDLTGDRFDPLFNISFYREFNEVICNYPKLTTSVKVRTGDPFPSSAFGQGTVPLIRIRDIRRSILNISEATTLDDGFIKRYPNSIPNNNELLIGMDGDDFRCVRYDSYNHGKILINQRVAIIKCHEEVINPFYLEYIMNSPLVIHQFNKNKSIAGTIGHISGTDIRNLRIPIPSPEIQETIFLNLQSIRDKANRIQKEALEIINNAKNHIEQQLLNKDK